MATPGTAKAKAKANQLPNAAVPPTVIKVTNGEPNNETSYVNVGGTVRFDNNDSTDYRIRLWATNREKHAAIDVLLPAVGSASCMTDPDAKVNDDVPFDLLPAVPQNSAKGAIVASGGGGKIIIGPTAPKKPPR